MRFPCAFLLAPGHLLLLRRLFSSNGEAYHCIPLSKSNLGEKGEVQRDSGRRRGEVLTSSQFPSCLILETRVLEIDMNQIKITGMEDEKKSNCCVSHSFLSSLDALSLGMHNVVYLYSISVDIRVLFFLYIIWYQLILVIKLCMITSLFFISTPYTI